MDRVPTLCDRGPAAQAWSVSRWRLPCAVRFWEIARDRSRRVVGIYKPTSERLLRLPVKLCHRHGDLAPVGQCNHTAHVIILPLRILGLPPGLRPSSGSHGLIPGSGGQGIVHHGPSVAQIPRRTFYATDSPQPTFGATQGGHLPLRVTSPQHPFNAGYWSW